MSGTSAQLTPSDAKNVESLSTRWEEVFRQLKNSAGEKYNALVAKNLATTGDVTPKDLVRSLYSSGKLNIDLTNFTDKAQVKQMLTEVDALIFYMEPSNRTGSGIAQELSDAEKSRIRDAYIKAARQQVHDMAFGANRTLE